MEPRRSTWRAAIPLAITWSVIAAATAIIARSIGDISQTVIVLSVIVIGFVASWVRTGHTEPRELPAHRAVRVPVRGPHPVG